MNRREESGRRARRPAGLRAHLLGFVLVLLLPVLALGAATAWQMAQALRGAFEGGLLQTTRALALALDRHIETKLEVATTLARAPLMERGDFEAARSWASEVAARLDAWVVVNEAEPGHRQVLNTRLPPGAPLPLPSPPGAGAWALIRQVVETRRPAVSDLFTGRATAVATVAVAAPVFDAAGAVRHVVVLASEPRDLSRLLAAQGLTGGAVAGLADGAGRIIARSRDDAPYIGAAAPEWYARTAGATEGLFEGRTAEGTPAIFGFHRLAAAPGWGVVLAEPLAAYRESWRRPLRLFLGGGALALAMGLALAWAVARRVLRPVARLVQTAEAVAGGARPASGAAVAETSEPVPVAEFAALRDATERAGKALSEAEARYRVLFEAAPFGVIVMDPATHRILDVNERACDEYGYTREEFLRLSIGDLDALGDAEAIRARGRAHALRPGLQEFEAQHRAKDGTLRDVLVRVQGVTVGGRRVSYGAHLDIGRRKAAEAAVRESAARLRLATEGAHVGTWELDLVTGLGRWSPEAVALFGAGRAGFTAADWSEAIHPEDRADAVAAWDKAVQEDAPYEVEFRAAVPDAAGRERWLLTRGRIERDAKGQPLRGAGVLMDVTARRRAEQGLRESEEILRLSMQAGRIGAYRRDIRAGVVRCAAETRQLHGVPPGEGPIPFEAWIGAILPADRARIRAEIAAAIAARAPELSYEYRLRDPAEGAVRHMEARACYQYDAAGRAVASLGVVIDVTARRLADEQRELLMREVDHRAKNALAVVQAAVRLTPKDDAAAFAAALEGRVRALARAQTMLSDAHWTGAELGALAEAELAPFAGEMHDAAAGGAARVMLQGPRVVLAPAAVQPVSMALHELVTNAAKHGALSVPAGRLEVAWGMDAAAGMLRLAWKELGGPSLGGAPDRRGFGSRMLEATVEGQLGGQLRQRWTADGLDCEILLPLERVMRRGAAA